MSQKRDHWGSLADLLGMPPTQESAPVAGKDSENTAEVAGPPMERAESLESTASASRGASDLVGADVAPPASEQAAVSSSPLISPTVSAAPIKPRRGSHWNTLANILGLGGLMSSPEPEREEPAPPERPVTPPPPTPAAKSPAPTLPTAPVVPAATRGQNVDPGPPSRQESPGNRPESSAARQESTGARPEEPRREPREPREPPARSSQDRRPVRSDDRAGPSGGQKRHDSQRSTGGHRDQRRERPAESEAQRPAGETEPRVGPPAADHAGEGDDQFRRGRRRRRGSRGRPESASERQDLDSRDPKVREEGDESVAFDRDSGSSDREIFESSENLFLDERDAFVESDETSAGPSELLSGETGDASVEGQDKQERPVRRRRRRRGRRGRGDGDRSDSDRSDSVRPASRTSEKDDELPLRGQDADRAVEDPEGIETTVTPESQRPRVRGEDEPGRPRRRRRRRGRRGDSRDTVEGTPAAPGAGRPVSSRSPAADDLEESDVDDDRLDDELDDRLSDGPDDRFDDELDDGLDDGVDDGPDDGADDGLDDGIDDGLDDELDEGLDEAVEGDPGDKAPSVHRGIPTWEETIGQIINTNMEARAKNPAPNYRGRGPRR